MKSSVISTKTHNTLITYLAIINTSNGMEGGGELYASLAHSEIFPINHHRFPIENRRGKIGISIFRSSDSRCSRKRTTKKNKVDWIVGASKTPPSSIHKPETGLGFRLWTIFQKEKIHTRRKNSSIIHKR